MADRRQQGLARILASDGAAFDVQDALSALGTYNSQLPPEPKAYSQRLGEALLTTWPAQMAKSAFQAATLPGDVYAGKVDPLSEQGIARSLDLAGLVTLGSGALPAAKGAGVELRAGMSGAKTKGPIRAYHAAYEPFDAYDFSRLGQTTLPNVSGTGVEDYAMNLARVGAWAADKPVNKMMAAGHSLPVDIAGEGVSFKSLDALEKAVRKAGGPDLYRESLLGKGVGHIKVADEEFGVNSFVGLGPDFFKIVKE